MAPTPSNANLAEMAAQFHLPLLTTIPEEILDPALVENLPLEWARAHLALPVRYAGQLAVLLADPLDVEAPRHLGLLFNAELQPVLAERDQIAAAIEKCYYRGSTTPADFIADLSATMPETMPEKKRQENAGDLLQMADAAPVSRLLNLILLEAVKANASDIHFEPQGDRLRVRYRIDGILYDQASPPKQMETALVSRLKVMAHMDIAERRLPQDGAARVRVGERELDLRISTIPVAEGERVVLRILNRAETLRPLDGLGMPAEVLEKFQALLQETSGMIAVCGPTGSGKTTTLYAALQQLDRARINILTIEDPVEYQLPGIGQMQTKPKIGLDFAEGLRHVLRQDPDVILVGEVRDRETAEIAVRAALTGHLMFTTLHTNNAAGAVLRFLDMGIEAYLLAAALRAVLAQRLARRLCPRCRLPAAAAEEARAWLAQVAGHALPNDLKIWQAGQGCPQCREGYQGRIGIFELLAIQPAISDLIRSGNCSADALQAAARAAGMQPLATDGCRKILEGVTTLAEIRRVIGEKG